MSLVKCCFDSNELPEVLDTVVKKCSDSKCCCGCCSALRPRYKRLVDNIFPVQPQDGLVKSNMEKLTYYSLSSPEKLDRIGEYLFQKASRDIYRRRHGFVIIAMEAMDQLLLACHAQTLNLFVESFLKMVQKLLESTDPQLQILATQSFVRFANIEEDTPSYHRRYDFFVSKFSAMCHSNEPEKSVSDSIRLAGIRGLQAVVRKTVSDDLVENIWEQQHMDKIVPSLLFNMQNSLFHIKEANGVETAAEDQTDPPMLAETCMRELVGRASFGHIRSVLKPVLKHFDNHNLWVPNKFAIHTFRIIMFSIQAQYSYTVVETLMGHLDENSKSSPKIRTSIADVLSKIIAIAAGESVGPSVLEIINSLIRHLQSSVQHGLSQHDEKLYQEALINALGEFANHLPDYQKIEIMMFIMNKVHYPLPANHTPADTLFQSILLKSLLKVGTKYQTVHLNSTFPVSFLHPLLRMSLADDTDMRLLVQRILHTLIDRHRNQEKLSKPTVNINDLELTVEKSSRPDLIFINKHGPVIYDALYTSLAMESNTVENIEAVYTTLALLCVELASHETVIDLLQLVIGLQGLAMSNSTLSNAQKFNLHAIVASLLVLIPNVVNLPTLADYAAKVIETRKEDAPHLLPELLIHYSAKYEPASELRHCLVDEMEVCESLKTSGLDSARLQQLSPYGAGAPGVLAGSHRHSWVEMGARGSVIEISNGPQDVDSETSSPGMTRCPGTRVCLHPEFPAYSFCQNNEAIDHLLAFTQPPATCLFGLDNSFIYCCSKTPEEELTFESMKRVLTESNDQKREQEAEKRQQISETFRTAPFNELMRRTQPKHDILQNKLNEIFKSLSTNPDTTRNPDQNKNSTVPVYEQHFPELFVY